MNQFAARYKTLSNSDLLKIVDKPADYQPEAIIAAENELTLRNLSEAELADANAEIENLEQEKLAKTEKKKAFENKLKTIGFSIADTINPIQDGINEPTRIINILIFLFCFIFLFQFFSELPIIKFTVRFPQNDLVFKLVIYLLPLVIVPVAAILFWRRKILGWILGAAFLICSALIPLIIFIMSVFRHFAYAGMHNFSDRLITSSITSLLFYGGCLWLIFKNDVREAYKIDKSAIIIAAAIGLLLMLAVLFAW